MEQIEYRLGSVFRKFSINETCSEFLRNRFPFQIHVLIPFAKRILPQEIFFYFYEQQKEKMWIRLLREIEHRLKDKICFERSPISNSGPRYFAWKIYFATPENKIRGYGFSLSSNEEALSKALGEFLERYSLTWKFLSTTGIDKKLKTVQEVRPCIDIQAMALYLPWQKEKIQDRFIVKEDIETAQMAWIRVSSLLSKFKKRMAPLQRIVWQYSFGSEEKVLSSPTTSGAGGGFTEGQSILSAMYELVERDSFMCHWLLKLKPPRIRIESITIDEVRNLHQSLKIVGIDLHFLNTTTVLGIPSVCAVLRRQVGDRVQIAIGSATGFSVKKLFLNSAIEALVVGGTFTASKINENEIQKYIETPFAVNDLNRQKRLELWRGGAFSADNIKWILEGNEEDFDQFKLNYNLFADFDEKNELRVLKESFKNIIEKYGDSYHPYIFTVPRKKLLASFNYFVSKAVVSSLFALYLNEQMATLDFSRLKHWRDTAYRHGRGEDWHEDYNTIPHPFP